MGEQTKGLQEKNFSQEACVSRRELQELCMPETSSALDPLPSSSLSAFTSLGASIDEISTAFLFPDIMSGINEFPGFPKEMAHGKKQAKDR